MRFERLDDWLCWQESLNPAEIELGLERVASVLELAGLPDRFTCPLITIAGTNGKGSVLSMLESIAMQAGLRVCSYTSPHIFLYNERIKVNGKAIDDASLCAAFDRVDSARCSGTGEDVPLTYFEFGTLAAIDLFHDLKPDIVLFEVGLGGRLDATNIMQPDVSVLTSVAIDHTDWLGSDRESIGREKAGIFRAGKTVVCGEPDPPASVISHAESLGCEMLRIGEHYQVLDISAEETGRSDCWMLNSPYGDLNELPSPALTGEFQKCNAATAIVALQSLYQDALHPVMGHIDDINTVVADALRKVELAGRFQTIHNGPLVIVDVAHNQQAARMLASQLAAMDSDQNGSTHAVIAMLADKDIEAVIEAVADQVDHWCLAGLDAIPRGLDASALAERLLASKGLQEIALDSKLEVELAKNQCTIISPDVMVADTVAHACQAVLDMAEAHDRIIVFGSFYTVTEALNYFQDSEV